MEQSGVSIKIIHLSGRKPYGNKKTLACVTSIIITMLPWYAGLPANKGVQRYLGRKRSPYAPLYLFENPKRHTLISSHRTIIFYSHDEA